MSPSVPALAPVTHTLLERPGVRHGFFTRQGGVSTGLYDSLNTGVGSKDDPAAVAEVGAVALPGRDLVLRTDQPQPLPPAAARPRMLVSRTRPAAEAVAVADALGAELVAMGSAGAKAMAVILGQADIYLHTGGQYEWDSCAPAAVALAHGLHVSRIDGTPLIYNQADTYMPDLLVCRKEHAGMVLDAVTKA